MVSYLSVCSGIEAASVAWGSLGWLPLAFSEIEPFPRAVLAHHYPDVPLHGDFTVLRDQDWIADADVLVGGTPCQAFSVAGLRNSLSDERGNLSLEFVRLADAIDTLRSGRGRDPAIIVWENVPGVLSVKDNAFGCFLAGLAGDVDPYVPPRGKWTNAGVVDGPARTVAWRVLDAQYFGLAQRRRRVFVVASAREGFDPAAILLEFEGLRRDSPPRRETRESITHSIARSTAGGGLGTDFDCDGGLITLAHGQAGAGLGIGEDGDPMYTLPAGAQHGAAAYTFRADAMREGTAKTPSADAEGRVRLRDPGMGMYEEIAPTLDTGAAHGVAYGFQPRIARNGRGDMGDMVNALNAQSGETGKGDAAPCVAVAFTTEQTPKFNEEQALTLTKQSPTGGGQPQAVMQHMAVRRLTPVECSRLQGFPDDYLLSVTWRGKCPPPDGPMYKALGNSMAVPCMRWIGQRIAAYMECVDA